MQKIPDQLDFSFLSQQIASGPNGRAKCVHSQQEPSLFSPSLVSSERVSVLHLSGVFTLTTSVYLLSSSCTFFPPCTSKLYLVPRWIWSSDCGLCSVGFVTVRTALLLQSCCPTSLFCAKSICFRRSCGQCPVERYHLWSRTEVERGSKSILAACREDTANKYIFEVRFFLHFTLRS